MNISNKYFNIIYDEKDSFLANKLFDYLNDNVEGIYDFFDPKLDRKKIDIKLLSKKEYDELHKKNYNGEVPKWSVGFYENYCITYVSLNDYKNTSHNIDNYEEALDYYLKTIVHEYVHFVTSEYCLKNNLDRPIKYLNEGIAQILSGQREKEKLVFKYDENDVLDTNNNYQAWYMATKYILDTKGKDCFFELLSNKEKAKDFVLKEIDNMKEYYHKNLQK